MRRRGRILSQSKYALRIPVKCDLRQNRTELTTPLQCHASHTVDAECQAQLCRLPRPHSVERTALLWPLLPPICRAVDGLSPLFRGHLRQNYHRVRTCSARIRTAGRLTLTRPTSPDDLKWDGKRLHRRGTLGDQTRPDLVHPQLLSIAPSSPTGREVAGYGAAVPLARSGCRSTGSG